MKKITLNRKTKNDLILTASVITVAAVVFFIIGLNADKGATVEIKQNGQVTAVYSLSENKTVKIENGDSYNLLIIDNGEAYIESASCPDKVCVHKGKASKNGETIVCLPNKTVITVRSKNQKESDF